MCRRWRQPLLRIESHSSPFRRAARWPSLTTCSSGSPTFASVLIAASVNAKAITVYMGHASIESTFDLYGKLMPGSEAEAAALVDSFLARADTSSRIAQLDE
jgi:integrase